MAAVGKALPQQGATAFLRVTGGGFQFECCEALVFLGTLAYSFLIITSHSDWKTVNNPTSLNRLLSNRPTRNMEADARGN